MKKKFRCIKVARQIPMSYPALDEDEYVDRLRQRLGTPSSNFVGRHGNAARSGATIYRKRQRNRRLFGEQNLC
ncbi:MAG TPA: hypothetical protein VKY85_04625 [Candidatus Angelobacter sp.]|nr:hypothetical protein [Candidatus Angelobacter sp.]